MKEFWRQLKKVPGVFWYLLILGLAGALTSNLEQFFPTNTYWWSALIVSVCGGVLVPAIIYVWGKKYGNPPVPTFGGTSPAAAPALEPDKAKPGLLSTIVWGNK